jgi:hypothetical protein
MPISAHELQHFLSKSYDKTHHDYKNYQVDTHLTGQGFKSITIRQKTMQSSFIEEQKGSKIGGQMHRCYLLVIKKTIVDLHMREKFKIKQKRNMNKKTLQLWVIHLEPK